MAEERTTDTSTQAQDSAENNNHNDSASNTQPEKKYTDDDVNGIVKKNSSKAVNNWLKDLGITDPNKAREILSAAVAQEQQAMDKSSDTANLQSQLEAERADKERAFVENIFLTRNVDASKVSKAVRLIDLADCRNENGVFDREKATAAVDELLKDWPELKKAQAENQTGFVIGSDGNQNAAENKGGKTKPPAQKSWNRFN